MTHMLQKLASGYYYGVELRPEDHAEVETIVETRDLPGFVERGVTYESHHFWIHFLRYKRTPTLPALNEREREERRNLQFSSVFIRVRHGGGWELWRGDYMLARALRGYGDDDRGLFRLCWYLVQSTHYARQAGRDDAAGEYRKAFVDGRLKKRKLPARGVVKVWIEPKKVEAPNESVSLPPHDVGGTQPGA